MKGNPEVIDYLNKALRHELKKARCVFSPK